MDARPFLCALPLCALVACANGASSATHTSSGSSSSGSTSVTGSGGGGSTGSGGTGGTGGTGGAAPVEPPFDSIPWEKDGDVGYGVQRKDSQNPLGENVFIGYGGYGVTLDAACAWTTALYHATLHDRGIRYVYCVQGPAQPDYSGLEIGNSKIVAHLLTQVSDKTKFILAVAHSSGTFVAHELLGQLQDGHDPMNLTADKVVYFDLDGAGAGLSMPIVQRLHKAYFVGARDTATDTLSPNHDVMVSAGQTYASAGGFWELDTGTSGCNAGAKWCVHMTVITTLPHDPASLDVNPDYSDFSGREVVHTYLDTKAAEAGLD